jgi:hypothetical protein
MRAIILLKIIHLIRLTYKKNRINSQALLNKI